MSELRSSKLAILPDREGLVPKYSSLSVDYHYFDLDSLVRMYGRREVESFLGDRYPGEVVKAMLETSLRRS